MLTVEKWISLIKDSIVREILQKNLWYPSNRNKIVSKLSTAIYALSFGVSQPKPKEPFEIFYQKCKENQIALLTSMDLRQASEKVFAVINHLLEIGDEEIRNKALANLDEKFINNQSKAYGIQSALLNGFTWETSPEKDNYWKKISEKPEEWLRKSSTSAQSKILTGERTIKEWFELILDETERSAAIENLRLDRINTLSSSLYAALDAGIYWSGTAQGSQYWTKMRTKYQNFTISQIKTTENGSEQQSSTETGRIIVSSITTEIKRAEEIRGTIVCGRSKKATIASRPLEYQTISC